MEEWLQLLPSADLMRGDIVEVEAFDEELLAYRTDAGTAHVCNRRCPHAGASLAFGYVEQGCIVCPFHHWRFGPDGTCAQSARIVLEQWPVKEEGGWIWIRRVITAGQSPAEENDETRVLDAVRESR